MVQLTVAFYRISQKIKVTAGQHCWITRCFWVLTYGILLLGSVSTILAMYSNWQNNPVVIRYADKSTLISEIPFPAITICPLTKFRVDKVNITKMFLDLINRKFDNWTYDDHLNFQVLSYLCSFDWYPPVKNSYDTYFFEQNIGTSILNRTKKLASDLRNNNMMVYCSFQKTRNCSVLYKNVLTDDGVCFTFNSMSPKDLYRDEISVDFIDNDIDLRSVNNWTMEDGYNNSDFQNCYPYRGVKPDVQYGMRTIIGLNKTDIEAFCQGPIDGFKVLFHTPDEIPTMTQRFLRAPLDQEVMALINPTIIKTSEDLRSYSPHIRNCYFNSERWLRFFKVYNQINCEVECLSNYTKEKCGCVKFSMPHDNKTEICEFKDRNCILSAEDELLLKENQISHSNSFEINRVCNCLPACTSIEYNAEISQAFYNHELFMKLVGRTPYKKNLNLRVFFKEKQFLASVRTATYSTEEFLANCGGLLGIFVGFSLLSLVKVIYDSIKNVMDFYCKKNDKKVKDKVVLFKVKKQRNLKYLN